MSKGTGRQMSESTRLAVLLAIVGGFLESYTFFCRGGVFANCQTGNLVMMALSASQGQWKKVLYYTVPVFAFFLGILLTEYIRKCLPCCFNLHWRQIVVFLEFVCLVVTSFIPHGRFDPVVTTIIAFVCSMQVESFRKIHGSIFASTMCTGNLRSAADNLFVFFQTKDKKAAKLSMRYFLIVIMFMLGAVVGAVITRRFSEKAVLFCCIILCVVFFMMFIDKDKNERIITKVFKKG